MSALKFDILDMIREPDNYTSTERALGAEAVREMWSALQYARAFIADAALAGLCTATLHKIDAATARIGGAQ